MRECTCCGKDYTGNVCQQCGALERRHCEPADVWQPEDPVRHDLSTGQLTDSAYFDLHGRRRGQGAKP